MKMKSTKGGRVFSSAIPRKRINNPKEMDTWRECFAAAISGTVCAHRGLPNPEIIIKLASAIADRALDECRKRTGKIAACVALWLCC